MNPEYIEAENGESMVAYRTQFDDQYDVEETVDEIVEEVLDRKASESHSDIQQIISETIDDKVLRMRRVGDYLAIVASLGKPDEYLHTIEDGSEYEDVLGAMAYSSITIAVKDNLLEMGELE